MHTRQGVAEPAQPNHSPHFEFALKVHQQGSIIELIYAANAMAEHLILPTGTGTECICGEPLTPRTVFAPIHHNFCPVARFHAAVEAAEALRPFIPQPAPAGYWNSPAAIRDEIAGLELDIESWQATIDKNTAEIPRLQLESLKAELSMAKANLKLYELRAKLAARTGGAQ